MVIINKIIILRKEKKVKGGNEGLEGDDNEQHDDGDDHIEVNSEQFSK